MPSVFSLFFSQQKYFEAFHNVMGLCESGNMENRWLITHREDELEGKAEQREGPLRREGDMVEGQPGSVFREGEGRRQGRAESRAG